MPAGHEMLRILKESLAALPPGIEKVRLRMDSAGYQHDVLKLCATGDGGKREMMEFTVSDDMTAAVREAREGSSCARVACPGAPEDTSAGTMPRIVAGKGVSRNKPREGTAEHLLRLLRMV